VLKLVLRRLLLGLLTVGLVSLIIFGAVEALPGDACTAILERDAHGAMLENCRAELGLDRPAWTRYGEWVGGVLRGDLGLSTHGRRPIAGIVGDRLENSLLLGACALALGLPLAFGFGVLAALQRDRRLDVVVSSTAIAAMTIPEFVSATVLILLLSAWLGWLPGIVTVPADAGWTQFFPQILLPMIVLAMVMTAHILRTVRSSMIEVLDSDFVRMATLKGLAATTVLWRHGLKNAMIPVITMIGLQFGGMLAGAVVTETVFSRPGVGRLVVNAILAKDYPLVQGCVIFLAFVYLAVNLVVDIAYAWLDPRIRYGR